jgi:5-oxopent-3-ene-1,2,5-tricarboxylate decarboxylase/2-hydroxyhepta-2,4-diene-1,7-dioate isomerase
MLIAKVRIKGEERWSIIEHEALFSLDGDLSDPRKGPSLNCSLDGVELLAPVENTSKIILLLGNWAGKDGRDGPAFILKPSSAVINPGENIVYPNVAVRVHAEPELGIVIGHTCRGVSSDDAQDYVLGFTIANDTTMFEMSLDTKPMPFLVGKCVDTFGGIGPWIVTGVDGDRMEIKAFHDGELYLQVNTSEMAWSTSEIVSWVSTFMTLHPGDIICCGAPVGYNLKELVPGSRVRIEIEGIGMLESLVVATEVN